MRNWILLLALIVPLSAEAKRPKKSTAQKVNVMEVFTPVFDAMESGDKQGAAEHLVTLIDDEKMARVHAQAYSQLAALMEEFQLPITAQLFYQQAFAIDGSAVTSSFEKALTLSETSGDTGALAGFIASNPALLESLSAEDESRSRLAVLAARAHYRNDNFGEAIDLLESVSDKSAAFTDAQNLLGVIYSMRDQPEKSLVHFQIAAATATKRDQQFQDSIQINIARSYYATNNFPKAIFQYTTIPRASIYWLDSQFERAWAHFRIGDMTGTIGLLHTLNTGYFADQYYPEAELLRIYALLKLCKFPEANQQIDLFQQRFSGQKDQLLEFAALSAEDSYHQLRADLLALREHQDKLTEQTDLTIELPTLGLSTASNPSTKLPAMVSSNLLRESRFEQSVRAIDGADDELKRLQNPSISSRSFAMLGMKLVSERRIELLQQEHKRISTHINDRATELKQMLSGTELTKLDILELKTQMLEQASLDGKMEEARRTAKRKKRRKSSQQIWPYDGEIWADELGYYQVKTKSECPASLTD